MASKIDNNKSPVTNLVKSFSCFNLFIIIDSFVIFTVFIGNSSVGSQVQ
jgi:hypothetical protein